MNDRRHSLQMDVQPSWMPGMNKFPSFLPCHSAEEDLALGPDLGQAQLVQTCG